MSDDLKPLPCPFCGEQEGVYSEAGTEATGPHAAIVRCSGCNAVHCHNTEAEAIAAWNRRAWRSTAAKGAAHRLHDVRARYITEIAKVASSATTQEAARHQDAATTARYTAIAGAR